jgi:hypothetical protein
LCITPLRACTPLVTSTTFLALGTIKEIPPFSLLLLDDGKYPLHVVTDHLLSFRGMAHQVIVDEAQPDINRHVLTYGVLILSQPNEKHIVIDVVVVKRSIPLIMFVTLVSTGRRAILNAQYLNFTVTRRSRNN